MLECLDDPANIVFTRACLLQIIGRLELALDEMRTLKDLLRDFMFNESSIVKTFSLQLMADLAAKEPTLQPEVLPQIWETLESGTPAMRARKLLRKYHL